MKKIEEGAANLRTLSSDRLPVPVYWRPKRAFFLMCVRLVGGSGKSKYCDILRWICLFVKLCFIVCENRIWKCGAV